jgi:hypothetical protein
VNECKPLVGGAKDGAEDKGLTDRVRTSYGAFIPKEYDDVLFTIEKRVARVVTRPLFNSS